MKNTTPKEQILKRIRDALIDRDEITFQDIEMDSPVYPAFNDTPDIVFARNFIQAGGKFIYCANEEELAYLLNKFLTGSIYQPVYTAEERLRYMLMQHGIDVLRTAEEIYEAASIVSFCDYMIARTGSVVYSSWHAGGRKAGVAAPVHIFVGYASQIVEELKDALRGITEKYKENIPSLVSFITGPSRTADIEKTLVKGVHGPKELYLFFVDEAENH